MTISAPLSGSADMTASFPTTNNHLCRRGRAPRRGAHPSQPDLSGQHALMQKPARRAQQTFGQRLVQPQIRGGLMAKPRRLAFRVSPGGVLSLSDSIPQPDFAPQMAQEFG